MSNEISIQDSISVLARMTNKFTVVESGCWEWKKSLNAQGYGSFWLNGRARRAHRVSLELFTESIPDGKIACHKCNNKRCMNPDHLYAGTYSENTHDSWDNNRRPHTKPMPRGEKHSSAKLLKNEVLEIFSSSETLRGLAKKFGVTHATIKCIKNGKTWSHITKETP